MNDSNVPVLCKDGTATLSPEEAARVHEVFNNTRLMSVELLLKLVPSLRMKTQQSTPTPMVSTCSGKSDLAQTSEQTRLQSCQKPETSALILLSNCDRATPGLVLQRARDRNAEMQTARQANPTISTLKQSLASDESTTARHSNNRPIDYSKFTTCDLIRQRIREKNAKLETGPWTAFASS